MKNKIVKNPVEGSINMPEDMKKLYEYLQYMAVANILLSIAFIMYMIATM